MAIRIGKADRISPESRLNMQTKLDLWKVEQKNPEVFPFPAKTSNEGNKEKPGSSSRTGSQAPGIERYQFVYIIVYISIYIQEFNMAKVLLSLPDDILKEIDDYRNKKGLKRNQFFISAVKSYFMTQGRDEYFNKRKIAVENIRKTSKKIMDLDLKGWDPVKDIKKERDGRANELLKRWEKN